MENLKQLAKNVDRYSIIRLNDGRLAVWERKAMTAITEWNKSGIKLKGDTEVEVVKFPAHLAADYLRAQNQIESMNAEIIKDYPVQDETWASRRWNEQRTEFQDLSGVEL